MKSIAFFNNKGGVGKTTLVYHVAAMMANMGMRVLCTDLDPQANLTAMFLDEISLEVLYEASPAKTIFGAVRPIVEGLGDVLAPHVIEPTVGNGAIGLVAGDVLLANFETRLAQAWPETVDRNPAAARASTSLARAVASAARTFDADMVLMDVGPNLGAINRAAMIAADAIVVPLAPDLFSLRGLRNLGPTLRAWRGEWRDRYDRIVSLGIDDLPTGRMQALGYVVLQHAVRLDRPVQAYAKWVHRIPQAYASSMLDVDDDPLADLINIEQDSQMLAMLKNYRSLMPLAQEANKPMFSLRAADGAIGAQQRAVTQCYRDFEQLTRRIVESIRELKSSTV